MIKSNIGRLVLSFAVIFFAIAVAILTVRFFAVAPAEAPAPASQAATAVVPFDTGLSLWYAFENGAAASIPDMSGNSRTGALKNGAAFALGAFSGSRALMLDGVDDYVSLGNNALGAISGGVTVAAWIKTKRPGTILSEYQSGVCGDYYLRVRSGGALQAHDGASRYAESSKSVSDGLWHHIAAVTNSGGTSMYIDGIKDSFTANPVWWRNKCGTVDVESGRLAGGSDYFSGSIGDLRVYNRALAADEVSSLYKQPAASADSAPAALIPPGSAWKYYDKGTDLGTGWKNIGYGDSAWPVGNSQLGYGDGDEATVIGYGPNAGNKYVTTYFRKVFSVSSPRFASLTLKLLRDDGAVAYLNGREVARSNMPSGAVNYATLAAGFATEADETTNFYSYPVDPSLLRDGLNVLAVEVHQSDVSSSDISFDLELNGVITSSVPPPSDTMPPVRSGGSPTGALPSGTTSVTLALGTNESSTCRYSNQAGVSYSSMTKSFATDNGLYHTASVSGLSNGATYAYYIRCTDAFGNANTSDYSIAFSVVAVTPPPPTSPPPPANAAPTVNAGADRTITLPSGASLSGAASDDGLPNPPHAVTVQWSKISGPGTVSFSAPGQLSSSASFSVAGAYVLRLTVSDGALSASDDISVGVLAAASQPSGGFKIDHSTTDASAIPQSYLDSARNLDVYFQHMSIGNNILDGLRALTGQNSTRYGLRLPGTGIAQPTWYDSNFGVGDYMEGANGDPLSKVNSFNYSISTEGYGNHVKIAMMKFCSVDNTDTAANIWNAYRPMMESLEQKYPGVTFVWWTMPIQPGGDATRDGFNALVRNYAAANGKVLFDIAGIESHDPAGNLITNSGHEAGYSGYMADSLGHLSSAGQIRLANAWWVLMARLAGWSGISSAPSGTPITVTPQMTDLVLQNPFKGFATYVGTQYSNPTVPQSLAYSEITWRELEPTKGNFNWALLEKDWSFHVNLGRKIGFRFQMLDPSDSFAADVPQWLIDEGVPMYSYTYTSGRTGLAPDWDNPTLLAEHDRVMSELGKRYNNDPRVAWLDVGSYGFYGEWHMYLNEDNTNITATQATRQRILDAYLNAFPNKKLVIAFDNPFATKYITERGGGIRNDCLGPAAENNYFVQSMANDSINVAAAAAGGRIITGEFCNGSSGAVDSLTNRFAETLQFIKEYRWSWVGPNTGPFWNPPNADLKTKLETLYKAFGYNFAFASLTHEQSVAPGGTLHLTATVRNTGSAPFYYPWPLEVSLINTGTGAVVASANATALNSSADPRAWLPGDKMFIVNIPVPSSVPPATYSLGLAILDPATGKPAIQFNNANKGADGRYRLSSVIVK